MTPSAYDEDNYLDGNPFYLRFFEETYQKNKSKWHQELKDFYPVFKLYDELVTEIAIFIKHLGYTSSIDCSIILSYLINCGYLSHNLEFNSKVPNENEEIDSCMGTNIVIGNGCCRHFASMHTDVFSKLGIETSKFYCYDGDNPFNRAKRMSANHVINLIEYDGNMYGIDLYNSNRLFRFRKPFILTSITTYTNSELRYKPYYEIIRGESTLEDIIAKIALFEEYSKRRWINPYDYYDGIKIETESRLRRSEDDMMDFHEETKLLKKEISEEMQRGLYQNR